MELKRHFSLRTILVSLCFVASMAYLVYGLMPAEASTYAVDSKLIIPSINLSTDVAKLVMTNGEIPTPDTIVGSFSTHDHKTLLVGHSSTVFNNLENVKIGDEIFYRGSLYRITSYNLVEKNSIKMGKILASTNRDSLVLMTCAGEDYGDGNYSHRLIINAILR
ncbi:class F sortase [Candidatus Saccharibacteria bacterium]|nr:class F sortase [Candidatus Saccharibacteria bacterium]